MLTKEQVRTLRRLARRLVDAELDNAWRGAGPPEDIPVIERALREARERFNAKLKELTERAS